MPPSLTRPGALRVGQEAQLVLIGVCGMGGITEILFISIFERIGREDNGRNTTVGRILR